jgi:hypothetical protein
MARERTRVRRGCRQLKAAEREPVMKIKLDIDCTAEEARRFFGLPDVQPLQEALLQEVQQQISANIKAMDAKTMVETWLPASLKGFEQLQQMFMAQLAGAAADRKK